MFQEGRPVVSGNQPASHPLKFWLITGGLILVVGGFGLWFLFSNDQPKDSTPKTEINEQEQSPPEPLQVEIDGLKDGQEVTGTVTLGITVDDLTRVAKVEYYLDTVFLAVTYAQPFSFDLDTSTLLAGEHTITIKVYDTDGQVTTQEIKIVVPETSSAPITSSKSSSSNTSGGSSGGSGGGSTPPVPDTTAPSTPSGVMLSADDGYTVNLSWSASTDNVGVTQYQIFRGGAVLGTSTDASYQDQTVVPGNSYDYYVVAKDAANNISDTSTEPSITLVGTSIWINGDTPLVFDNDATAIEVGVKFRPLVDGLVTGVKFYKGTLNTGTHVGNLWASGGSNLATATFSGESASGWQQVTFSTPVSVTAGTTYVASYFAPNGRTSFTNAYFATKGITSQYLRALASGVDGNNGVFRVGAGFPSSSFNNTNYWVDVTFTPNPAASGPAAKALDNSKVYTGFPGSNNTGVPVGKRLPVRDRAIDARQPGATIENIEVYGDSINVFSNNTTIKNVRVTSPVTLLWGIRQDTGVTGLTVQDSEVYGDGVNKIQYGIIDAGSDMTVERVNIHTISNGIQANQDLVINDSFVHDLLEFSGDHNDSFISTGGDNMTLTHNTFHNPIAQTSALGLFCDFSPITNVTATNNLLMGGGYAVYGGGQPANPNCDDSENIKFTNNRFSREIFPNGGFNGPVIYFDLAAPGNEWTGNVWHDDGTPVTP